MRLLPSTCLAWASIPMSRPKTEGIQGGRGQRTTDDWQLFLRVGRHALPPIRPCLLVNGCVAVLASSLVPLCLHEDVESRVVPRYGPSEVTTPQKSARPMANQRTSQS